MLARHLFTFEHSHVSTSWLLRFNRVKNGNRVNGVLASGQIICGWDRHVKWKHAVNHFAYCHIIRIPDSNISLFVSIKCLNWMHWIWWLCVHNERMGGDIMRKRGERGDNKEQMRQRAYKKRKLAKFCFYKTTIQTKGVEKFFRFHYNLNTQRQHTDSHTELKTRYPNIISADESRMALYCYFIESEFQSPNWNELMREFAMSHRMDTYANIAQKSCGSKVDTERRSNEMKFGLRCDGIAHTQHTTHKLKTWKSQRVLSDLNFLVLKPNLFFCLCISNLFLFDAFCGRNYKQRRVIRWLVQINFHWFTTISLFIPLIFPSVCMCVNGFYFFLFVHIDFGTICPISSTKRIPRIAINLESKCNRNRNDMLISVHQLELDRFL